MAGDQPPEPVEASTEPSTGPETPPQVEPWISLDVHRFETGSVVWADDAEPEPDARDSAAAT